MASNTYVALDSKTVGTAVSSVTFTSIPSGYTDLVIVCDFGQSVATANTRLRFNGDTGNNYSYTNLRGNGSSAASSREANISYVGLDYFGLTSSLTNISKINIQNYSNTTTYKSVLLRTDTADYGTVAIVGTWRNTAAITSIEISSIAYQFIAGSTFNLYGIAAQVTPGTAKATGGTITYDNYGNVIHTFTSSGTFTPSQALNVEYLVIAGGGGGGGGYGAGGGAGGYLTASNYSISATGYTVTVGAGGNGGASTNGSTGSNSVFGAITASGGGYGAGPGSPGSLPGGAGGSGGGAGYASGTAGAASPSGQGYPGGTGPAGFYGGSGGGGAGGAGQVGASQANCVGGIGLSSSISGTAVVRASGGSGYQAAATTGGGGSGLSTGNRNATANTGGGGGTEEAGPTASGGNGGSGIVIIRYSGV